MKDEKKGGVGGGGVNYEIHNTICLKSTRKNINLINHPQHQIFIHIHVTVVKDSPKAKRPCHCPFNEAYSTYYKGSFYPYESTSLDFVHLH